MSNKQLYEKENNINKPFFPVVRLEDIIDTISEKSIQWILNNYNHIYVEWKNNVVGTRLSVPTILRRNGLWITYNDGNRLITEYYIGKNTEIKDKHWQNDANWEDYTNKLIDGTVEYRHLSESLKQLFNKGNITNFPDEEDLTSNGVALSFKDREYQPENFSGFGRVILRKNIVRIGEEYKNILTQSMLNKNNTIYIIRYDFTLNGQNIILPDNSYIEYEGGSISNGNIIDRAGGLNRAVLNKNIVNGKNILTQEMVSKSNTIYEIRHDFDLNGEEIIIPEGCVLNFQGGSFNNGTIKGDNTLIQAALIKIFGLDIELIGDWNILKAYPEWFGAKGDGVNDCTKAIQKVLDLFPVVKFGRGTYIVTNSLIVRKCNTIVGCSTNQMHSSSVIKYNHSSDNILLFCENLGTPYISISNLCLVGPDPTVENAVYKEGVTCIDITSGNNLRLNNVWAKNFEYIIYSNYNSYYNKFEDCRFENAKYILYNFSANNLVVNNCKFLYFYSAILVNGDGPLSVTGNSFEVFNGNIIYFLYNCEQATFMNNYIELYDSYKLPALFPDNNKGYFGGNNLFYGKISRFTSIGNEFQVNGAFRIYWFETLTNFVSIGNHFYIIDGDCNVDAYTVIDNSPKLSNFVALDSLDKRVNTSENIRYGREYTYQSIISPSFDTIYNIIGTDPFNGLNFLNTSQYIGMSPNRIGGWWIDDNDPILVGRINNGYFIKGRIIRRKDFSSEASDYLVTLPDVPNIRKNRPYVLYFNCVNSNYDTVVISINVQTREVYLVKGSKDYDIYLDGITIYDMY